MNHLGVDLRLSRKLFGHKNDVFLGTLYHRSLMGRLFTSQTTENPTTSSNVITSEFLNYCNQFKPLQNSRFPGVLERSHFGQKCGNFEANTFTNYCGRLPCDFSRAGKSKTFFAKPLLVTRACSDRIRKDGCRMFSSDNKENRNEPNSAIKMGLAIHISHPIDWLKNLWYLFIVQGWLDSSFSRQEFLYGARQALCHLTRLAVLEDFDGMKMVASTEVVKKMKEIVSAFTAEQLETLEILPENINLAKFTVSSVQEQNDGCYAVAIDVYYIAIRMFQSRPLVIQMKLRFNRDYEIDYRSDWRIASIQEFTVMDLGSSKDEDKGDSK